MKHTGLGMVALAGLALACAAPAGDPAATDPQASERAQIRDGSEDASETPRPGAVDPGAVPFDLGAIMEQVHFAYRPTEQPGRYEGGHATYAVEADAQAITLRAYHAPNATPTEGDPPDATEIPSSAPREVEPPRELDVQESAPLHLEVTRLARGSRRLSPPGAGVTEVASDGHLTIARGDVVEHIRNRDDGVEQSWAFARLPAGTGDLRVRVEPQGMRYIGKTAGGIHLADATGLGFRYGHGTWIDAAGRETHVPARWSRGGIELVVPAGVVEDAAYPAVLDPTISPEIGMDEPVLTQAANDQQEPSVASNGIDYLVAWQDLRSGVWDVYGTRVSAEGAVLDTSGLALSTAPSNQLAPSVASNGADYLVAWQDQRSGSLDIYATRVSADGAIVDASGLALSTAANNQFAPSVASNGSDYLVAWSDGRSGSGDIYGTRVSAAGTALDASGLLLSGDSSTQQYPSVASNGADYFVAWMDFRSGSSWDIYGTRVSAAGAVLDESGLALSTATSTQQYPSVASNGTDYLVAWHDFRSDSGDIYGTRVSAAGGVLEPSGLAVSTAPNSQVSPSVASNGTDYLIAWSDDRSGTTYDIYATRVSATGAVVGAELALSTAANHQWNPSVASNGTDYLVAWQDRRSGSNFDIYGARVSAEGAVQDTSGLVLAIAANHQRSPSVASNGTDYLMAWHDYQGGSHEVYGARVSADGVVLDASGLALSTAANEQQYPSVASNGTDYLVAWHDLRGADHDIYGTRVSADGVVLDASGLALSTAANGQQYPRVASNGTDYLVVWHDRRRGLNPDIYGTRVRADGAVLDASGLAISVAATSQQYPSVASNGTDYLVAWHEYRGSTTADDIYGTRVSADGAVLDAGLALSTAANQQQYASVASNGTDYLVAWQDLRSGSTNTNIYGTRVSTDGAVLDASGLPLSTASNHQLAPSVASSGADYLVVWRDFRFGTTYRIYGTRVRAGVVESPAGLGFAAATGDIGPPEVAGSADAYLLVYERFVPEAPLSAPRARASSATARTSVISAAPTPIARAASARTECAAPRAATAGRATARRARWRPVRRATAPADRRRATRATTGSAARRATCAARARAREAVIRA